MARQPYDDAPQWKYKMGIPAANLMTEKSELKPDELSQVVGVDGRYRGVCRRHPGMKFLKALTMTQAFLLRSWYVSIQKGTSKEVLRGFITHNGLVDGQDSALDYSLYDTETAAWVEGTIWDTTSITDNRAHPFSGRRVMGTPRTAPFSDLGRPQGLAYDTLRKVMYTQLYDGSNATLVALDPNTGRTLRQIGVQSRFYNDFTYDDANDILYACSDTVLYSVDVDDAVETSVGSFSPVYVVRGLAWDSDNDQLYALSNNSGTLVDLYKCSNAGVLTDIQTLDTVLSVQTFAYSERLSKVIGMTNGNADMREYDVTDGTSVKSHSGNSGAGGCLGLEEIQNTNVQVIVDQSGNYCQMLDDIDPGGLSTIEGIDCSSSGRYAYCCTAVKNSPRGWNLALYWNGTTVAVRQMGANQMPRLIRASNAPVLTWAASGGILLDGSRNNVAMRYVSRRHGTKSPLMIYNGLETAAGSSDVALGALGVQFIGAVDGTVYDSPIEFQKGIDRIEVYRSIAIKAGSLPADLSVLSNLYLETTDVKIDWAASPIVVNFGDDDLTQGYPINDSELSARRPFNPALDFVGVVPRLSFIRCTDDQTFVVAEPYNASDMLISENDTEEPLDKMSSRVMWSPPEKYETENFRGAITGEQHRFPDASTKVLALERAGDYVFAVTEYGVVRFNKSGAYVSVLPFPSKWGCITRDGVTALNNSLMVLTTGGLIEIDAASMQSRSIGIIDDLITKTDQWRGNLAPSTSALGESLGVQLAYDQRMGCIIVMNGDEWDAESYLLWPGTGCVTSLERMGWIHQVIEGVDPVVGGTPTAFFLDINGQVRRFDYDEEADQMSMHGQDAATSSLHGTVTTGDDIVSIAKYDLKDTAATFDATMVGQWVYFHTGNIAGSWRQIAGYTSSTHLTFYSNETVTEVNATIVSSGNADGGTTTGDVYSISTIPFRIQSGPLPDSGEGAKDTFRRRRVTGMSAHIDVRAGDVAQATNPTALMTYRIFKDLQTTANNDISPQMSESPTAMTAAFGLDKAASGGLLYPEWECLASNVDFTLISGVVYGKIDGSDRQSQP